MVMFDIKKKRQDIILVCVSVCVIDGVKYLNNRLPLKVETVLDQKVLGLIDNCIRQHPQKENSVIVYSAFT